MISTTTGNPHHPHPHTNNAHGHALPHAHGHPHSLPKPGQLGGPLSLALEKGGSRARMDSQKFLIPSLPVSSRPDPGGQKRRERSIVNGTASLTPNENGGSMYQAPHPQQLHYPNFNGLVHGGLRRGSGGYTGLPPPTNSPRKDAHSPMYHSHHIHPMAAAAAAADHDHKNYLGQHRASVPIPCSSPARAASASPKSGAGSTISPPTSKSSYSASASPQLPGDRERDRDRDRDRLYTAGFPHHTNLGVSSHAAALYAAAAAAQPLPYAALFGGYPHSAATTYLDNFHSSIMAQQQKNVQMQKSSPGIEPAARRGVPPDVSAYYPATATTSFHTKLIDSALPIERLYNGHHHYQQQQLQQQHTNGERERERDRDRERGHLFPSLPNGVSVSVSKGSPAGAGSESHRVGSIVPNFHSGGTLPPGKPYFNANSKLSLSVNGTPVSSNKFWGASGGHLQAPTQPFKATSPGVLGKQQQQQQQQHEDYKSSILYCGGKEGSLKHRILSTRSPEAVVQNSKHVFTFPNLSSTPVHAHAHTQAHAHAHPSAYAQSNGAVKHEWDHGGQRNSNAPWNYSMADSVSKKSPPAPTPTPASSPSTPFKYLSQVYKPSNSPQHLSPAQINNSTPTQTVSPKTSPLASPTNKSSSTSTPVLPVNGIAKKEEDVATYPPPVKEMPKLEAFNVGSLIRLATGDLRLVEDLKAEDFLRSAAVKTDPYKVTKCTVTSIQGMDKNGDEPFCKVTLAVAYEKQLIVVDAKPEQPFFVLGRGWSSCSPVETEKMFHLPCTPLEVGDVCITISKQKQPQQPSSPTVKSKNLSILSSPKNGSARPTAGGTRLTVPKNGAVIPRMIKTAVRKVTPKSLEVAQAMLPPPCPLTPKTISKISAVVDEKVKVVTDDPTPSVRPTTPKKRRWSAPEVLTDEDSGEENKGEDCEAEVVEQPVKTESAVVTPAPITV